MAHKDEVLLLDPTAQLKVWGSPNIPTIGQGFWVKGNGWETKITYSEDRAWELASVEASK
jgi:hypothetical protein